MPVGTASTRVSIGYGAGRFALCMIHKMCLSFTVSDIRNFGFSNGIFSASSSAEAENGNLLCRLP